MLMRFEVRQHAAYPELIQAQEATLRLGQRRLPHIIRRQFSQTLHARSLRLVISTLAQQNLARYTWGSDNGFRFEAFPRIRPLAIDARRGRWGRN